MRPSGLGFPGREDIMVDRLLNQLNLPRIYVQVLVDFAL